MALFLENENLTMFNLFIKIVVALIIVLIILFLIWLIAFMIHIVRDQLAIENKQKSSPKLIDIIVNRIAATGLQIFARVFQIFHPS